MVCWAISQFYANAPEAQVEIASAGGIRLVFLLGHDTVDDLSKTTIVHLENGKSSLQSSSLGTTSQNSWDNEDPETKAKLNSQAARALWKLAQNNVQNSKSITDTRALLCFARLIQFENDENDLQYNFVIAVMEIARADAEQMQNFAEQLSRLILPLLRLCWTSSCRLLKMAILSCRCVRFL